MKKVVCSYLLNIEIYTDIAKDHMVYMQVYIFILSEYIIDTKKSNTCCNNIGQFLLMRCLKSALLVYFLLKLLIITGVTLTNGISLCISKVNVLTNTLRQQNTLAIINQRRLSV